MNNMIIPCETVVNIIATWPRVTRNDIEHVRQDVMEKYFPDHKIAEEGIETQIGYAFQEMRYLHLYLNANIIGDEKKLLEDEMWYLTEWLQRNRVCYKLKDQFLFKYDTKSLSKYYTDKTVWIIDEMKEHANELKEVMNS